ncbi:MAG: hypothetical protein ACQEQV_09205 [Fibrobacterota bacterium]
MNRYSITAAALILSAVLSLEGRVPKDSLTLPYTADQVRPDSAAKEKITSFTQDVFMQHDSTDLPRALLLTGITPQSTGQRSLTMGERLSFLRKYLHDSLHIPDTLIREYCCTEYSLPAKADTPADSIRLAVIQTDPPVLKGTVQYPEDSVQQSPLSQGDTISLEWGTSAELVMNNGYTVDAVGPADIFPKGSRLGIARSAGATLTCRRRLPLSPLLITHGPLSIRAEEDLILRDHGDTLFLTALQGSVGVTAGDNTREIARNSGCFITPRKFRSIELPLPPRLIGDSTIIRVAGLRDTLRWSSSAEAYDLRLITPAGDTVLDTLVDTTTLIRELPFGDFTLAITAVDVFGFRSVQPGHQALTIKRESGLRSLEGFSRNDSITVNHRFFTFQGSLERNVEALVIDSSLTAVDSTRSFSEQFYLHEGLNTFDFVLHYPDSSRDTIEKKIFYTGHDERYTIRDSLMGQPAFTPTGKLTVSGRIPEASRLIIDGDTADLKEDGSFTHTLNIPSYGTEPVAYDITYNSGNTRVVLRNVEHIETTNSLERNLRSLMEYTVLGGLLYLITFGLE